VTALALEAKRVRDAAHLSDRQIAAATGAQPSTVRDWLNGRSAPTGRRADRLIELAEMTDRLARVMHPTTSRSGLTDRLKRSATTSRSSCWPAGIIGAWPS
jgi:transcriptional regulator with XRE-family HTH domain